MKTLKVLFLSFGVFVIIGLFGLIVLGTLSPETFVYNGSQVPERYMKEIRSLGLLEEDETIKYFYSDGLIDIKSGLYFVTDKNLVVYSKAWEEPETIIGYSTITSIEVVYDESYFIDTSVTVITDYDLEVFFPISSEKGRDKKFVEYLAAKSGIEPVAGSYTP